jgi:hypothetical protein
LRALRDGFDAQSRSAAAALDDVARLYTLALHACAVHERAVATTEIDDGESTGLAHELAVVSRRVEVDVRIECNVVVGGTTDANAFLVERQLPPGVCSELLTQPDHRRSPHAR